MEEKFLGFFAVTPNEKFWRLYKRAGVKNVLISFHYIRKNPDLAERMMRWVKDVGGHFMTDSGAFTFFNDKNFDFYSVDWNDYFAEYIGWLDKNKQFIFCAANLDLDKEVGCEQVDRWNRELEKLKMNIVYLAHENVMGGGKLDRFKYYIDKMGYKYVGVNEGMIDVASMIYSYAKQKRVAVHGFAWTKPTVLRNFPFFSVDSSSWVLYQKRGVTPVWDGTNFTVYDNKRKDIRRTLKKKCEEFGVKFYEFCYEKDEETGKHNDDEGLTFSLKTWLEVFESIGRIASNKLDITVNEMEKRNEEWGEGSVEKEKGGKLGDFLETRTEVLGEESKGLVTYERDKETGSEVAVYKAREEARKTADEVLLEEYGNSGLFCDNCMVNTRCPKFKSGYACAYNFTMGDGKDLFRLMDKLIEVQGERVARAMYMEKMEGGQPNKIFSTELALLKELVSAKAELLALANKRVLEMSIRVEEQAQGGNPEGFMDTLKSLLKK